MLYVTYDLLSHIRGNGSRHVKKGGNTLKRSSQARPRERGGSALIPERGFKIRALCSMRNNITARSFLGSKKSYIRT